MDRFPVSWANRQITSLMAQLQAQRRDLERWMLEHEEKDEQNDDQPGDF